ncbi:hypothetical protein ElyMa_000892900 [Elysia marginata]|uniref:Uncharacterized protein n=1 Tax=Elysia marginata TaxID=1093978 RepID=A0AAV4H8S4_9GAST|nr:hypothetical protein ElyMa_000892900 [Elysia marginata]
MQIWLIFHLLLLPALSDGDSQAMVERNYYESIRFPKSKLDGVRMAFEEWSEVICNCNKFLQASGPIDFGRYDGTDNLHDRFKYVYQVTSLQMYSTLCSFKQGVRVLRLYDRYYVTRICDYEVRYLEKHVSATLVYFERGIHRGRFKIFSLKRLPS